MKCEVRECERDRFARQWCGKHYQRWYHNGDPTKAYGARERTKECRIEGCVDITHTTDAAYCRTHSPVVQRGGEITYSGAHQRATAKKGKASLYPCAHCPGVAEDWAYDHEDINERQSERGPYSVDPDHYISLCRSCHTRFDSSGPSQ